jgi:hypothetical protein
MSAPLLARPACEVSDAGGGLPTIRWTTCERPRSKWRGESDPAPECLHGWSSRGRQAFVEGTVFRHLFLASERPGFRGG